MSEQPEDHGEDLGNDGLHSELPPVPSALIKTIQPLLNRSKELISIEPIISYFCKLDAVELILDKKLHLTSNEISSFTMSLLDHIEFLKKNLPQEELNIINDKDKSYKYVEDFAIAIFNKSYLDVINHTTSKSTVSTFNASIVFLNLLKLWNDGILNPEILMKLKYAKFHAMRIIKDYKEGKDPNDYMPPEDLTRDVQNEIDESLSGTNHLEKENDEEILLKKTSFINNQPNNKDFSLPQVPNFIDKEEDEKKEIPNPPSLPNAPNFTDYQQSSGQNDHFSSPSPVSHIPTSPSALPPTSTDEQPPHSPSVLPSVLPSVSQTNKAPSSHQRKTSSSSTKYNVDEIITQEQKISKAQKYCKFAVSALNYEDIETAIQELKNALNLLEKEE
ncbi:hypothetical protein PACTADRAFT_47828 [Pachysolen tannophilus NRRL Y-2460]|uniref:Vta1 C-terminal domain-containing protein n=1 Tax=Pachysolen tannophilus NRRL Y-2460 TaxID=669874 RepID=A0A1E4U1W7_PACTA|nr:hypothetical protein PACTADRAFT_47828 [Pachysolen tannophilus NRRL Y-2460]